MHTIVLAEPRKSYRAILKASLSTSFDVICAESVQGALRAVSMHGAKGIVAGLLQSGQDDGLQLCRQARRAQPKLITIVYGAPAGGVSAAKIDEVEREYDLTLFLARPLAAQELADQLVGEIRREFASTGTAQMRRLKSFEGRRAEDMPTFSARADRSVSEDTWAELMHREVSPRSIKELAGKPIAFEPIDRSWSDEDPSWAELMRTKATPGVMRVLVRKGLGIRVKKPA